MDGRRDEARRKLLARLRYFNRRVTNPITLTFAGRRLFAVVEHVGRRSGRAYQTPVLAEPFEDGYVIPLTYGDRVDWYQNVLAAGTCTIRWQGEVQVVDRPQLIPPDLALPAYPKWVQRLLRRNKVSQFLWLRKLNGQSAGQIPAASQPDEPIPESLPTPNH